MLRNGAQSNTAGLLYHICLACWAALRRVKFCVWLCWYSHFALKSWRLAHWRNFLAKFKYQVSPLKKQGERECNSFGFGHTRCNCRICVRFWRQYLYLSYLKDQVLRAPLLGLLHILAQQLEQVTPGFWDPALSFITGMGKLFCIFTIPICKMGKKHGHFASVK